ncbi:hypothetical protein IQ235_07995 [Oscillatoriales cyanobacterium LEGE 11467]|uniref:Uncharacterized protein n=1 Tax=Zarconia navalis LEGE 11467 TaxID=1828826 RepID=A0A928Z7N3_9CYAN|nr:hypothetical protein [Zarconia navalis]MBE9040720.1 hypothetical protein [Zarconia navalis LEGE 11467]
MVLIREIVRQTLETGYLSLSAEDRLRQLLTDKYDVEDFKAFIHLQQAAVKGQVKQESRELRGSIQTR